MSNKKERRKIRHEKNKQKEIEYKESAWNSGKLIEERHDGFNYSEDYTNLLSDRLVSYIKSEYEKALLSDQPSFNFVREFRKYRIKIRDLIILWNPNVVEGDNYNLLKDLIELYWDEVVKNKNFNSLIDYLKSYDKF